MRILGFFFRVGLSECVRITCFSGFYRSGRNKLGCKFRVRVF